MENSFFSYDNIISGQNLALTTDITREQIKAAERKFNYLDLFEGKHISQGIVEIMKEPDFCFWSARHLLNHNITPQHALVLSEMWTRPFPMLIACRGWSKTYSNAMLAILKMRLEPGTKIVGVGSSFRQSKLIWEYMKFIWEKSDVLRSTCGRDDGPKMHTDRTSFRIGDSIATFIPIGAHGDKIRGLRANSIFSDEFGCLSEDSLVETDRGLIRIKDSISQDFKVRTGDESLPYEKPEKFIITPPSDVYKIKLANGYIIKCSPRHQFMTLDGWKKPKNLSVGDYIESNNDYKFPIKSPKGIDKITAWLMGILVSEGSITDTRQISVSTTDKNLKDKLMTLFGFKLNITKAYIDHRGWKCKKCYRLWISNKVLREKFYNLGLDYVTSHDKKIPWSILQSTREHVMAFLEGLFEGDGSAFLWSDKWSDNRLGVSYYSVSETLCRDVQIILNKLGYDSYITDRESKISENRQWMVRLNGRHALDFGSKLDIRRFKKPISLSTTPSPKHYCWDKTKKKWHVNITYLGKTIQKDFKIEQDAINFIEEIKSRVRYRKVISVEKLPEKQILYDYYLPTTHSFYANAVRNHNSIPIDIYEKVIVGFGAVSKDPVMNAVLQARKKRMMADGEWSDDLEKRFGTQEINQQIITGTAGYGFEHFYKYWKRYSSIINETFDASDEEEPIDIGESRKNYSIVRINYSMIPEGFMDSETITRAKSSMLKSTYNMEYEAVFALDSEGFFRKTLIDSCTPSNTNPIVINDKQVSFLPKMRGDMTKTYVLGLDPASEYDNLSIVILELLDNHSRIVHVWTINKKRFRAKVAAGLVQEHDYFQYCVRKVRELMAVFPVAQIMMDSQGGGHTLREAFANPKDKEDVAILEIIEDDKEKITDNMKGFHILQMCNNVKAKWLSEANHGMKFDMENKFLLFPEYDFAELALAAEASKDFIKANSNSLDVEDTVSLYDTLEDVFLEIEELKKELISIEHTKTASGVERWDTPAGASKGTTKKKDRYSALMMANKGAREISRGLSAPPLYSVLGRVVGQGPINTVKSTKMYSGPEWYKPTLRTFR